MASAFFGPLKSTELSKDSFEGRRIWFNSADEVDALASAMVAGAADGDASSVKERMDRKELRNDFLGTEAEA